MIFRKEGLFFLVVTLFLFPLFPSGIFAYPVDGSYNDCPSPYTCTGSAGTCAKNEPGNCPSQCGSNTSGECAEACGGMPAWSKYRAVCKEIFPGSCQYRWVYTSQVCSTGDKCIAGEKGLRSGACDCGYGSIYKTCCSGGVAVACNQYGIQDGTYPDEGVCPGDWVWGTGLDSDCISAEPTPTPGGPTNTPAPAWCAYDCVLDGLCPSAQQRSGACDPGKVCCELGQECPLCVKGNPPNPYGTWTGDHGQANAFEKMGHYHYLSDGVMDQNCVERYGTGYGKKDTCADYQWVMNVGCGGASVFLIN